jgi:hypothetical protein
LLAVFSDVFLGARPDEVDFQVGEVAAVVVGVAVVAVTVDRAAAGEVPVVDVVGPEVLYAS